MIPLRRLAANIGAMCTSAPVTRFSGISASANARSIRFTAAFDAGGGVVVDARLDVRRADHGEDTVRRREPRHLERHAFVAGTIVEPRQDVAVQVDHVSPRGSKDEPSDETGNARLALGRVSLRWRVPARRKRAHRTVLRRYDRNNARCGCRSESQRVGRVAGYWLGVSPPAAKTYDNSATEG